MPAALRNRYFSRSGSGFEVAKPLRAEVVFGEHDLSARVPFPRIDLLLCRNVLIYFTSGLQRAALETFAFSLRTGGVLVLGQSESVTASPAPYAEDHARLRIYRRLPGHRAVPHAWPKVVPTTREPATRLSLAIDSTRRDAAAALDPAATAEAILLGLDVGVVVVDPHYDIVRINTAARRVLGVHGTAFEQDFIHLADVLPSSAVRSAIDAALRGKASHGVYEIESVDVATDATRFIEAHVRPDRGFAGTVDGAVIELTDITAIERERRGHARTRQRLDKAAALNERLLRANDELTALDRRAPPVELGDAPLERGRAGRARGGRDPQRGVPGDQRGARDAQRGADRDRRGAPDRQRGPRRPDRGPPSPGRRHEQQKRATEEEHDRLGSILASIGDAVVAVDHDGKTVATNVVYDRLFGGPDAEILLEDVAGLPFLPDDRPQRRAARGERFRIEFAVSDPDGQRHWFEAVAEPLTVKDRTWGGVVSIRDVSERTMRLSLERLMGAAGHELKTPTAAIHNYLQLIARRLASGDTDDADLYAGRAMVQAQRLDELVDRLFDVTRIRSGRLEIVTERVDLVAIVREATEVSSVLVNAPAIEFSAKPASLPIQGDAGRLEQVFLNLVANAIEHAAGTSAIEVSVRRSGAFAAVEVRDHGRGIARRGPARPVRGLHPARPAADCLRSRAGAVRRPRDHRGARRLDHGDVGDRNGHDLHGPAARRGAGQAHQRPHEEGRHVTVRLAIVEDHPALADGLATLLRGSADVEVVGTAPDLAEATALLEREAPDVVLCDIRLAHGDDGFELVRTFAPKPAFIMLTVASYPSYHARAVELGAMGYLSKMATVDEILDAIRTVAAGRSAYPSDTRRSAEDALRVPTTRELEILVLVAEGLSNVEIADRLSLRVKTVESQLRRLFDRYDVTSRTALARLASRQGWIDEESLEHDPSPATAGFHPRERI